ncbi:MAG: flavin reductase family protein [Pseudooceanicola nanhaiensis]|jgi:flavin reductase (DIM6/NTAB) family NADH-FMN oxidoreductase RutF|uniref:flavin reductase family protein n=1 Tax=Pseudooceanicola nanhaiensis TaxID=375761 RepID=UPI00047F742C
MGDEVTGSATPQPPEAGGTISAEEYTLAMRRVVSPVAVITAAHGGERNGLTATAICSATTEPPTVLVCINREASALRLVDGAGSFAVNFLSETQSDIARAFSTRGLAGETRLRLGSWTTLVTGVPVLTGAVSTFDCVVAESIPVGTHQILLGRVVGVTSGEDSALLYRDGFFRRVAPE